VEGRLNQPKQKGASDIHNPDKDGVHTRATLRHVIEKRPTPGCREREREKRNRNHERHMDRWNRRTEKIDRIYEENRIIPRNMMKKGYVWKIKN
jgi:hypothetical protein